MRDENTIIYICKRKVERYNLETHKKSATISVTDNISIELFLLRVPSLVYTASKRARHQVSISVPCHLSRT